MADNEIVYEVKANTKSVEDSLKKVDSSAKDVAGDGGGFGKLNFSIASLATAAIAAGAAIATYLVGQGLKSAISEAITAEDSINRMNQALNNAGRLSQSSSEDFKSFASELQNITTYGDDATMQLIALGTAFTKTNQQTKTLTLAAMDMSAALGISAETAVRQLGGTLSGSLGMLGRFVPELRGMKEEALKSGKALDIIAQKFGGAAAAQADTFSGKLKQVKNAFGDMLEEIGFFFTKSKTLNLVFESIKKKLIEVTNEISVFRTKNGDIWDPIIRGILTVGQYFVVVLGPALDLVNNTFNYLRKTIGLAGEALFAFFSGDYGKAIRLAGETLEQAMSTDDFKLYGTQAGVNWIEGLKERIAANAGSIQEVLPEEMRGGVNLEPASVEKTLESLDLITFAYVRMFNMVTAKMEDFRTNQDKLEKAMKKGLFQTMANGVQSAMNSVGQALVNGGNAFEAFGKSMLTTFGQMATQMGMFYFLTGIAMMAVGDYARGAASIAGGLALMVFGGVLTALGGGGGTAPAGGGAATAGGEGGTAGTVGDSTVAQNETEQRERQTNVEVVVQGNVIGDKREFGIQIADAINEAFGNDGIVLARGAIS